MILIIHDQLSGPLVLCWLCLGCRKRRLGIQRESQQIPLCYPRIALVTLLGHSCGGLNISLGKYRVGQRPQCPEAANTDTVVSSNHVPWIIIGVGFLSCMILLFSIRVLLARENKRRDSEPREDSFEDVHVMKIDGDGNSTEFKVSKVCVSSQRETYISG